MANSVVFALENVLPEHLYNVGTGDDLTIKELALMIQKVIGHTGELIWDSSKNQMVPQENWWIFQKNAFIGLET